MRATEVFEQSDGEVTKAYYAEMNQRGPLGQLSVALFRAHKRSTAAKKYHRGKFRLEAYGVKNWSLSEICRILESQFKDEITWGWQRDQDTPGFEWVLYVELPTGQCSFHSAQRLTGPDFHGTWDGKPGGSLTSILNFCEWVSGSEVADDRPCWSARSALTPQSIVPYGSIKERSSMVDAVVVVPPSK